MTLLGIEGLNVYAGQLTIDAVDLAQGRGLDLSRLENVQQIQRSVGLGFEDPITNAVNAAKPLVDALHDEKDQIELLVVASESGVDYSKSIASYVHKYLELSTRCRFLEVKQACYSATGVIQLAMGYLHAGLSPNAKILVISSDIALVDERAGFSEVSTGFGGVAMILSANGRIAEMDLGAFGLHSYETLDSARPLPTQDIANVDRSLFAYLDCLDNSFTHYAEKVEGTDFLSSFGLLAMHTPFAGIVKAGHRKIMRERCSIHDPDQIEDDFQTRVAGSLVYPKMIGNLCSGSLYLALASTITHRALERQTRIGMFAYGSGCSSEFFSMVIGPDSMKALKPTKLKAHLDNRRKIDFNTYQELLTANLQSIVPFASKTIGSENFESLLPDERAPMLILDSIKDYYRQYRWI